VFLLGVRRELVQLLKVAFGYHFWEGDSGAKTISWNQFTLQNPKGFVNTALSEL